MMKYLGLSLLLVGGILLVAVVPGLAQSDGFTQKDRELLIELKVKMGRMGKRFDQVNKQFEQVDKKFEQLMDFLYILAGIFTTLVAVVIGFAYWDRRTIIREARREAIEFMEREAY
jgi:hypothetical protein